MHIDVEKTIQVFGYDPQFFKPSSERLVVTNCIHCNKEQYKKRRLAIKTALCSSCSNRENAVKGANKRSDSMKLYYQSNPHPLLGVPRSEDTKQKISKGREGKYTGKNAGGYGKKARHGLGQYYKRKDGTVVWMRSSWEIRVAEYLDNQCIEWEYEHKAYPITYIYENNYKEGTYRPDFLLVADDSYWEVKGYWRDDAKAKYEAFLEQYPEIKIELLMKQELHNYGIMVR